MSLLSKAVPGKAVGFALVSLMFFAVQSQARSRHDFSVNTGEGPITSCDQIEVSSDGLQVARSEDHLKFPATSSTVRAEASENGGVYVYGWDNPEFSVLNCKAAAAENEAIAQSRLEQIKMSYDNGELGVRGPEDGDWISYLIIRAPRNSAMALRAVNGPISLEGLTGKLNVDGTNGPLAVKNCTGQVEADITNGPISYSGGSGNVHLRAENGPIDVNLSGTSWGNGELEAHSTNGPLDLHIPKSFTSGVLVEARGYSPFHCSEACAGARKDFDDENKSVQFGNGNPVIRLSTVNGPVSIGGPEME
jgi:hypothetical protein